MEKHPVGFHEVLLTQRPRHLYQGCFYIFLLIRSIIILQLINSFFKWLDPRLTLKKSVTLIYANGEWTWKEIGSTFYNCLK